MLYAWIGDQERAPVAKGERTTCRDCGGLLTAVMPVENTYMPLAIRTLVLHSHLLFLDKNT